MIRGLVRACHPLPTVAVTVLLTAYAFALGWRGAALLGVLVAVLVGQLSVGWSNDAHDAALDERAQRADKPTVAGLVGARTLWVLALVALATSSVVSWWVAGLVGGSFHVLALVMAWAYNLGLSRTVWSWLPYAVAFGAVPAFLSYGLDGSAPPWWAPGVFALLGVSGHLANALPDIAVDRRTGVGGLATRLGFRGSLIACWLVSGAASAILAAALWSALPGAAAAAIATWVIALAVSWRVPGDETAFRAVLAVVAVDVLLLVVSSGG